MRLVGAGTKSKERIHVVTGSAAIDQVSDIGERRQERRHDIFRLVLQLFHARLVPGHRYRELFPIGLNGFPLIINEPRSYVIVDIALGPGLRVMLGHALIRHGGFTILYPVYRALPHIKSLQASRLIPRDRVPNYFRQRLFRFIGQF